MENIYKYKVVALQECEVDQVRTKREADDLIKIMKSEDKKTGVKLEYKIIKLDDVIKDSYVAERRKRLKKARKDVVFGGHNWSKLERKAKKVAKKNIK